MSHPLRFFIENISEGENQTLSAEQSKHILKVLRLKNEDKIYVVSKKDHTVFESKIVEVSPLVSVSITKEIKEDKISKSSKMLAFALCKGKTNDLVIEKATELGVFNIALWQSEHSVVNIKSNSIKRKLERWNKIAEQAASQARLNYVPKIQFLKNITELTNLLSQDPENNILASLSEEAIHIAKAKNILFPANIIIGPEGDISQKEYELLRNINVKEVSLGSRVLRAETAAISSIAMLENSYSFKN